VLDLQEAIVKDDFEDTLFGSMEETSLLSRPDAVVEGLVEGRKLETSVGTKSGETAHRALFYWEQRSSRTASLSPKHAVLECTQDWSNLGTREFSLRP